MQLSVSKSRISGSISIPGSKSHTIRALAFASVARGASILKAPLIAEDTLSSLTAASVLGAWVKRGDDSIWKITGNNGNILQPAQSLVNLGNSGTGIKIFAALASLADFPVIFDGDESLRSRPMRSLLSALNDLGVETADQAGNAPFQVKGPWKNNETAVNGKSSQYLTALLMAAPLAKQDTLIRVENLNEIPYVDMTLAWLKRLNIRFDMADDYSWFRIPGNQSYEAFTCKIPGDFSTACFPLVAAAVSGGSVQIKNLDFTDSQGDKAVFDYLKQMGADIQITPDLVQVNGGKKLHAVDLDLNATPDALPILAVAAACAEGITVLRNVAQARIKETDRICCMARELTKMGIQVEEFEDGMAICGGTLKTAELESYKDHRIAMALAVAGFAAEPGPDQSPLVIHDAEYAAVTYPDFFEDFTALGADFYML